MLGLLSCRFTAVPKLLDSVFAFSFGREEQFSQTVDFLLCHDFVLFHHLLPDCGFHLFALSQTFLKWLKNYVSVLDKNSSLVLELGEILLKEGESWLNVGLDSSGLRGLAVKGFVVHWRLHFGVSEWVGLLMGVHLEDVWGWNQLSFRLNLYKIIWFEKKENYFIFSNRFALEKT